MADLLSHEQKENVAEITVSSAIKDRKSCGDVAACRTPLSSLSSQINISQSAKVWHESNYCTEASVPVKLDLVTQCSNTDVADFTDVFIDHAGKEISSRSEEMQQSTSQNSSSDQQAETSEQNEPEAEAGCSCTDIPDEHLSTLEVLKEDSQPHTDDFLLNKLANEFVLNVIINAACKLVIESKSSTNDTTSTTMSCQKKEKETPFKKYSPCKVLNQEGAKKCTDYLLQPLKFCYMEGENLLAANEMKDVRHDSNMDMFLSLGHCQSSTTLETSISDALDVNEIDELQSSNVTKKRSVVAAAAFSSQRLTTPAGYRCRSKRSLTVHSQPESLSSNLCPKLTTVNKAIQVENMETSVGVTCAEWKKAEVVSASTSPIVILEPRLAKLKNIEEEKAQLLTRCLQSEQQVKDLEFQLQKLNSKIPSVRTSKDSQLNGSKKKIDSLEAKILQQKKTIAELQAANRAYKSENSYKELQKAKGENKKWNAKFTEERAKLENVIGNLEQKSRQAEKQVALLNKKIADLENANQDMAGRFKETDEELKELKLKYKNECQGKEEQLKLLQTECESLKQELDDAKHALENREQEINVLQEEKKRMMESINYQQVAIAKLRKDCKQMAVIQNEMIDIQEQMKKMEISAAETQEFLEQERTALKDELMEKEEMVTELNYNVLQLTEENNALKDLVAQMKQQYTELAEDLNQTKAHAHTLLLQGNAELTVSGIAANKLLGHLYDFYDELTEHWNEECQREGAISKDQSQQMARESIVSTVMQSIKKQFPNRKSENAEESEGTKKDEDSNESLIVMEDELEVSGIKPLTGADNSIMTADVASSSDSSNSDNLSLDEQNTIADKNIEPLNKQIEDIDLIAQTTVKLFRNLYKLIKDHVLKLESEIQKIECNAAQEKRSLKALVNSLNKEIEQKCEREKSLHDELLQASKQIEQKDKEINDAQQLIMERTERMETLAEQLRTAKKQEKDIMKISTLLKEKDRELFVIKQTLSTDLEKIAQKYGSIATYPIKEIVHLRKENASLHDANVQLQREKEAICEKLSKRIEVYKSNWTLADAEVARLDRLIEKIRQALFTELESLQTFTQLQPILCELELINPGLDSQSA